MKDLLTSIRLVILSILVCCVVYPAAMLAFGQIVVPWKADGSLLMDDQGRVIGSAQIAQNFTRPEYFWPRPSAVDYNAAATGGSNLSPTNPKLKERAKGIIERYDLKEGERIPADLVTASGSGVDPHITLEAARFQLPRVAAARGLSEQKIESLIMENTEASALRAFGGRPVVNVLRLNLALDGVVASGGQ
ncbi:MAG: potassium-transporting ATPase subunit KdpC [Phycisphaerales bacterium]|jgi:K+-transporting ATPase ATPase C chain